MSASKRYKKAIPVPPCIGWGKNAIFTLAETSAVVKYIPSKIPFVYFCSIRGAKYSKNPAFAMI